MKILANISSEPSSAIRSTANTVSRFCRCTGSSLADAKLKSKISYNVYDSPVSLC